MVVKKFKVEKNTMEFSRLWSGLLYIITPKESTLGQVSVTIKKAVLAPFSRVGKWSQKPNYRQVSKEVFLYCWPGFLWSCIEKNLLF